MLTLRENIFTSKRSKRVISNILHFLLFSEGKISGDQLFAVNSYDVGSLAPSAGREANIILPTASVGAPRAPHALLQPGARQHAQNLTAEEEQSCCTAQRVSNELHVSCAEDGEAKEEDRSGTPGTWRSNETREHN